MKAVKITFEGSNVNNDINDIVTKLHRKKDDCPFGVALPALSCGEKKCSLGNVLIVYLRKDECFENLKGFLRGKRYVMEVRDLKELIKENPKYMIFKKSNYISKFTLANAKYVIKAVKNGKVKEENLREIDKTIFEEYRKAKSDTEEEKIFIALEKTKKKLRNKYRFPFMRIESVSSIKKGNEYPYKMFNVEKYDFQGIINSFDFERFNSYGLSKKEPQPVPLF